MLKIEGRDPSLWWLDVDIATHSHEAVVSLVRVRDFWLMTTTCAVYKLDVDHEGAPRAQIIQELS